MTPKTVQAPNLKVLPSSLYPIIDGNHITSTTGGEIDHIYAATGKPTTKVPLAGAEEIDNAVKSAQAALKTWKKVSASQRAEMMRRFAQLMEKNRESLSELGTLENGTAISTSKGNVMGGREAVVYNAGWTDKLSGELIPLGHLQAFSYTLHEPFGVILNILPFNSPLAQFCSITTCALAAGNCVVIKPSSSTPFSSIRYGELLLDAGFPPGVINIVPTDEKGGEILCSHPGINKIQLTGGVPTARKVMALAAKNITPVAFELGGKSPTIIFDDVDPKEAVNFFIGSLIRNAGQSCGKGARVLVQSGIYEKVIELTKVTAEKVSVGDPRLETTDIGAVLSKSKCETVMGFIERAKKSGDCRLITGGERLGNELADGYFIAPTIFADVNPGTELFTEEIFGPVLTFTEFETEEEAIGLANDTKYGLAGFLATNDLKRAHRVSAQVEAGFIIVNQPAGPSPAFPTGGYKQSGFGRIGGIEGIREFTQTKSIRIPLG
ncbi:MAG: aldehyde dehydrogenase [Deltaproteobacteria bacterium]|nr:aldehyde dehydrogenase [Deltaproteobacteria bacterium]